VEEERGSERDDDRIVPGSLKGLALGNRLDGFDGNLPETLVSVNAPGVFIGVAPHLDPPPPEGGGKNLNDPLPHRRDRWGHGRFEDSMAETGT
jgi:hypothetical protein